MIKTLLATALLLTACEFGPEPDPDTQGPPRIIHTGKDLVLVPGVPVQERLYVAGSEASAWTLALKKAPAGVSYSGGIVFYSIPEGLSGSQEITAIATRNGAVPMEASWTVTAKPYGNRAPKIAPVEIPAWVVGGTPLKIVFHAQDPDGDAVRFVGQTLPMGAQLKDSVLEWTGPKGQAVSGLFNIHATDGKNGYDTKTFTVASMSFDPAPYVADPVPGRSWWIRGFTRKSQGEMVDSNRVRRRITVTGRDAAAGTFIFQIVDTLGNADSTTRDTVVNASSRPGFGFFADVQEAGDLPFAWPTDASSLDDRTFSLQGKDYPAKWVFFVNTCLNGGGTKYGCRGSESIFAKGLGLVVREAEWKSDFTSASGRDSLAVWAIAGP